MVAEKTDGDECVVGEIGEDVPEAGCQRELWEREKASMGGSNGVSVG